MLGPADMPGLPPQAFKALVVGQQAVSKGRQGSEALNKVQVRAVWASWVGLGAADGGRGGRRCSCARCCWGCQARLAPVGSALEASACWARAALLSEAPCACCGCCAGHVVRGAATATWQRRAAHLQFAHFHQRAQRGG